MFKLVDLVEYGTATALVLREGMTRVVCVDKNGELTSRGWRPGGRGAQAVLRRVTAWDGQRAICSPGAHGSGQGDVRLRALMRLMESFDVGLFNERLDALRFTKKNDVLTIEHVRFER